MCVFKKNKNTLKKKNPRGPGWGPDALLLTTTFQRGNFDMNHNQTTMNALISKQTGWKVGDYCFHHEAYIEQERARDIQIPGKILVIDGHLVKSKMLSGETLTTDVRKNPTDLRVCSREEFQAYAWSALMQNERILSALLDQTNKAHENQKKFRELLKAMDEEALTH